MNSTRLQQKAIEAQIRYMEALGEASLERQRILEAEMKFRLRNRKRIGTACGAILQLGEVKVFDQECRSPITLL